MSDGNAIHKEAIIIDGHCDTILHMMGDALFNDKKARLFSERSSWGHIDLPRLMEGGVTCQVMALYIQPQYKPTRACRRTMEMLDCFYRIVEDTEGFAMALKAGDIEQAKNENQVCGLLSIEGGEAVEGSLSVLRSYYRMGIRAIGLTWNQRNDIADGAGEESAGSGLTEFGKKLVKEMEHLGMLVDVSHLSDSSFWSLDEIAERPYIASHSNARALAGHRRNLTDKQIEALAKKGGVIGVVFAPGFVDDQPQNVSVSRLCDHIDHIKKVAGIDHVGLGSDFDGYNVKPGFTGIVEDVSGLPEITKELVNRDYSEEDIKKVLGGNWLELYRKVIG